VELSAVRKIFRSILCLFFTFAPCFGQENTAGASGADAEGTPFRLVHGFLIVFQGRIGNHSALNFLLDTGTTHSTISRKLAQEMRVQLHPAQAFDFDRFVPMESGVFPDIQFGPIRLTDVSMLVADFVHLSDFAIGVDVIIGADLLSLSNFSIDFDAQKLFFTRVQAGALLVKPHPVVLILELRVQNCPVDLVVDTGVEGIVLFEDRLRSRIRQLRTESLVDGSMIGRQARAKQAILPGVRLGARTADLRVSFVSGPHGDALPGIDGYWGTAAFKAHTVDFNFAANKLRWQE
jgi:predicted aspartyl protease